jgi:hypothetical protein
MYEKKASGTALVLKLKDSLVKMKNKGMLQI